MAATVEQQRMCRETPREIQIMAREQHRAPARVDPCGQRGQAIDLVMKVEMRERSVEILGLA